VRCDERAKDAGFRGPWGEASALRARMLMTPSERNALLFFSAVALLGAGVRLHRATRSESAPSPAAHGALQRQIAAVDSARKDRTGRTKQPAHSAPPAPPAHLDLDIAPAESLVRLPRIGPALAKRIVADRDSLGPFGSLEGFQRVKGVGPAMARALDPYVTFSGTPRPSPVGTRVSTRGRSSRGEARDTRVPR
jgi:competence protein ComEA